ncbi:Uncharacterised protein [uncultured archaeon]|nr:Uncharacterised protein [uncultured archaeon]
MFGKPDWFERRKYGGWGLTPKTREGWLYIAAILVPLAIIQAIPFWSASERWLIIAGWAAFVAFDVFDIMLRMKKDERETLHEALAERNAAWVMVAAIALGILYQAASTALSGALYIDPVLPVALFAGLCAKAATNWKLSREN